MPSECRIVGAVEPTPFHGDNSENYLKTKYHCIMYNMKGTPYSVVSVISKPYLEVYQIQTPCGIDRFDIRYKMGGIFHPAIPVSRNEHTSLVLMLLNDERSLPFVFDYTPSDDIRERLFNMIRSACDGLSVQITNVVEHPEDYSVVYYMRTSNSYSYIRVYIDKNNFVTYAKPMSMLGTEDSELAAVIKEISNHFI
jgi:hypothetical protein